MAATATTLASTANSDVLPLASLAVAVTMSPTTSAAAAGTTITQLNEPSAAVAHVPRYQRPSPWATLKPSPDTIGPLLLPSSSALKNSSVCVPAIFVVGVPTYPVTLRVLPDNEASVMIG